MWFIDMYSYHAFQNFSKDYVSAVEPGSLGGGDEELGAVGVFTSVGHGEPSSAIVTELEVLVFETFAVNATSCG